jgi:hypothetical protein
MRYLGDLCAITFIEAARDLFEQSPKWKKDFGNGLELLYYRVPFSDDLWVTPEGLGGGVLEEVGIKLHARSWFDLYKPPGAPQLPLGPDEINANIEANDPLWQRVGYFAKALARTNYRIHSRSARAAVRDLATLPMHDLQELWIMV